MKFASLLLFLAPTVVQAETPVLLRATAREAARRNPYESREQEAGRAGRKLFQRECSSCHGREAQGTSHAPALSTKAVKQAPPGAVFWVLRNGSLGRGMPSFSHLPEERRWQIVTYLKSMP